MTSDAFASLCVFQGDFSGALDDTQVLLCRRGQEVPESPGVFTPS